MTTFPARAVHELLNAYANGVFPMAASATSPELYLQDPDWRGIIPLDGVVVPRRLARTIRQAPFEIHVDRDFDAVISGCAAEKPGRDSTWINREIRQLYRALFDRGHCHTVEAWRDGHLVGGLYGVSLKGAFFGESMFSEARDASKITLVYLCARLIYGSYRLLDTQFTTPHLAQFGTLEVPRRTFHRMLNRALRSDGDFYRLPVDTPPADIVEIVRHAMTIPDNVGYAPDSASDK
ncbi:MAG: leucyl/phenylalanyl-tRNA--protein transferase [Pseudomonadota bacterium]